MPGTSVSEAGQASGDWRMGYRTDVEYTFGFYPALNPDSLMLAATLRGVRPPAEIVSDGKGRRRLTYCELGCGQGLTINLMAARDPDGRYFGVDYNPAQIRNARSLAAAAGHTNLTLIEESFENLHQHELPDFDIVVLHGIYSWVSPAVRASIVQFLRRKLKAGGLCYISYNCAVGRGADQAMRELLRAVRPLQSGSGTEQAAGALAMVQDMAKSDGRYFALHKATTQHLDQLSRHQPSYIVHEYMHDYWQSFFFSDVARDMDGAKLSFAAHSDPIWSRTDLCLSAAGREIHDRMTRVEDRELIKDVWSNQRFRSDIFAKGPAALTSRQQVALLAETPFRLSKPRAQCKLQVPVMVGTANLPESPFSTLLDTLAAGPVTGEELLKAFAKWPDADRRFIRALEVLIAVKYAELATTPALQSVLRQRLRTFDKAIASLVDDGVDIFVVAAPVTGLAIHLGAVEYFLLRAHRLDPARRVEVAAELLRKSGRGISAPRGKLDGTALMDALETADRSFREQRLPELQALGIA